MTRFLEVLKAFPSQWLPPLDENAALDAVQRMVGEKLSRDEIFLGRAKLANDRVDRSGERFPPEYLERFAQTMPGKPLLMEHDKRRIPVGKWLSGAVARDEEGSLHLVGTYYLDAKSEAARLLRLKIAGPMSIGFLAGGRVCDLCGKSVGADHTCASGHRLNAEYDGKRATATYNGDVSRVEMIEGSLVGVGCQIGAEAIDGKAAWVGGPGFVRAGEESVDTKELEERVKTLEAENTTLKAAATLVEDGKLYRTDLLAEIQRKAGVLERDATLDLALLEHASMEQIKAYDARLQTEINVKFPVTPQSKMLGGGAALLPELRPDPPPVPGAGNPPPPGMRTSPFHMWDEEK